MAFIGIVVTLYIADIMHYTVTEESWEIGRMSWKCRNKLI